MQEKVKIENTGQRILRDRSTSLGSVGGSGRSNFLTRALNTRADASPELARKINLWLLAGVILLGVFYFSTIRPGHHWGDDFSMYINHAKNLAEGVDYKKTGYLYNPQLPLLGPKTYPPVFPLMLAPVYKFWGMNFGAMKSELIVIFLLSLLAIYLAFKRALTWPYLVALPGLIGLNPYLWDMKDSVISDAPFLLFVYLSIFLINRLINRADDRDRNLSDVIVVSLAVYLAYGTRSLGLLLLPSMLIVEVFKFRRLPLFAIKVICLTGVLIVAQNLFFHSDSAYADHFHLQLSAIPRNLASYLRWFSEIWAGDLNKFIRFGILAMLMGLTAIGYLLRLKKGLTVFEVFPILYLSPLIILPLGVEPRYLVPVMPLCLFFAFRGLKELTGWLGVESLAFALVVVVMLTAYAAQYRKQEYGPVREGVAKVESQQFFDFVKTKTGPDDVIIFRKPRALALFTGRKASAWHQPADDRELWNYFQQIKANYAVVGPVSLEPEDQAYLRRFIAKYPAQFEEVYSNSDFHVFKIKDSAATAHF